MLEDIKFEIDPSLLVAEYIKDKQVSEEDSVNLELFLKGDMSGWRFKSIPAPSLEELKALEQQVYKKQSQEQINEEALAFLASTDYMIIREMDAGIPCPPEVKAERAAARARIIK